MEKEIKWDDIEPTSLSYADKMETDIITTIISRRIQLKMTQSELAHKAGMLQQNISRIESFRSSPNLETLCNIFTALGMKICFSTEEENG